MWTWWGLVACGEGVDLFHPRAVRATMGSVFRLPVAATVAEFLGLRPKVIDQFSELMTIQETAKRHSRRPTEIFYRLYTRPPDRVLRYLYAGRLRSA